MNAAVRQQSQAPRGRNVGRIARLSGSVETVRTESITVLTNLEGRAQGLYDEIYCVRDEMENRIKEQ